MFKKLLLIIMICTLCLPLTGCGESDAYADDGKITIVAAMFSEYDWLRNLTAGSDNIELELLIDKGVDLHSYQPGVRDIVTISTCDVFVYAGGVSNVWVEDVLETAMNEELIVVNLMGLLEQHRELCGEEHHHHHEENSEADHDHAHTADEHIWLSLRNADILCRELMHILQELDGDNSELYAANFADYGAKIEALDCAYHEVVRTAKHDDILFADRFPFSYLMEDYGLHYHAAYEGCSAETEVGFETFITLSEELDELALDYVVVIDDSDHRIADTVIAGSNNPDCGICTLQSLQAVSRKQIADGITYLDMMNDNLAVFRTVLN